MFADLKFALRMLVKAPGFTVIAILTLALGIGANSAIFSVIDAVLLHPLPFPKSNQLVAVWSRVANDNLEKETESIPDYVDLRDQSQTLSALAAFTRTGAVLNRSEESRQLEGVAITSDIFPVLGIPPARGRAYTREDDNVDARVVVLTDYAWKAYFNSDPDIVGKANQFVVAPLHCARSHAARLSISGRRRARGLFDSATSARAGVGQ